MQDRDFYIRLFGEQVKVTAKQDQILAALSLIDSVLYKHISDGNGDLPKEDEQASEAFADYFVDRFGRDERLKDALADQWCEGPLVLQIGERAILERNLKEYRALDEDKRRAEKAVADLIGGLPGDKQVLCCYDTSDPWRNLDRAVFEKELPRKVVLAELHDLYGYGQTESLLLIRYEDEKKTPKATALTIRGWLIRTLTVEEAAVWLLRFPRDDGRPESYEQAKLP